LEFVNETSIAASRRLAAEDPFVTSSGGYFWIGLAFLNSTLEEEVTIPVLESLFSCRSAIHLASKWRNA
jgi:hypothetical protein